MSLIGKKIEEFNAHAYHQGEFLEVSEKDLMGNWSILCFYPADFTFVCPTELEDLQEQYSTLKSLGVEVFSCSTDTHFTLEYVMIGDPSHQISRIFDVLDEEQGLAQRGTFIIDPDGIVQAMEINADGIGRDASALIDKIRAAQYVRTHPGEVCPAKWKESGETLKPSFDLVGKI
ncbi:TPA: peroxiredoxin [Enterococcus faecium]|nr:peroxiredoxin [Enterococcus faecium]